MKGGQEGPALPFAGAGIYAIYYTGNFEPYREIAERNRGDPFSRPIYVGKAIPPGGRRGGFDLGAQETSALYNRLKEHATSIHRAENLALEDFTCRFLVVDDIWIPLAENLLIEDFHPLWNVVIDGFGNHDPGAGRYNQKRSVWDELHPGRSWAAKLQPCGQPLHEILKRIEQF